MMDCMITASFDDPQSAALAASTLAMVRDGAHRLQVTAQDIAGGAMAALSHPLSDAPWNCNLIQVRCSPEMESYAVGELAALGARKISVSSAQGS